VLSSTILLPDARRQNLKQFSFLRAPKVIVTISVTLCHSKLGRNWHYSELNNDDAENTMWIPAPIYERIPQFWILLGLLFISLGLYIGFDFEFIFFYLALGFFCFGRGIWIQLMRLRFRGKSQDSDDTPADDGTNDNTGVTPVGN